MKLQSFLDCFIRNILFALLLLIFFIKQTFAFNFRDVEKLENALQTLNKKLEKNDVINYPALMNFTNVDLSNIQRKNLMIPNANFQTANLSNTSFLASDLSNTSFINTNLTNADFSYCLLQNVNLTNANIVNTNFKHSILIGATGIDIQESKLLENFEGAIFDINELTQEMINNFSAQDYLRFFSLSDLMFLTTNEKSINIQEEIILNNQDDSINFFELLPDELILYIYQFLDENSIVSLCKTHKKANIIGNDKFFKNEFLEKTLRAALDLKKPLPADLIEGEIKAINQTKKNKFQYYVSQMIKRRHPYFLMLKSMNFVNKSNLSPNHIQKSIKLCYGAFKSLEKEEDFIFLKQYVDHHFFKWNKSCFEGNDPLLLNLLKELHE